MSVLPFVTNKDILTVSKNTEFMCRAVKRWVNSDSWQLRREMTSHMDSNTAGSMKYDRWNETVNMNEEASQSTTMRWDKGSILRGVEVNKSTVGHTRDS